MKKLKIILFAFILFSFVSGCKAQPQTNALQQTAIIPLQNVTGRIDHLSFDKGNNFVFVSALGNNTVEVIDLTNKKVTHSIKGLHEPQGVVFIPENNSLVITNGDNGKCDFFDIKNFQKINSIELGDDADNVRFDETSKRIYVGYGAGGIAIIDAITFRLITEIKFSGHPESFQIDKAAKKMYVNIPDEKQIAVIDLMQNKIVAQWKMNAAGANFPMALDEASHRLFIGCRHPAKLLVIDTETGKTISSLFIDGDTDDVFYNASAKENLPDGQVYVSCGSGYIDVINQKDADHYTLNGKVKTHSGARTCLFIPELHELLVASPTRMGSEAELIIYKTK